MNTKLTRSIVGTRRHPTPKTKRVHKRSILVRQLDAGLWVVRRSQAIVACCFDSREAAIRAIELSTAESEVLQARVCDREGSDALATYQDVTASLAARSECASSPRPFGRVDPGTDSI